MNSHEIEGVNDHTHCRCATQHLTQRHCWSLVFIISIYSCSDIAMISTCTQCHWLFLPAIGDQCQNNPLTANLIVTVTSRHVTSTGQGHTRYKTQPTLAKSNWMTRILHMPCTPSLSKSLSYPFPP